MLKAIAPLLQDDAYLSMSRGEFTAVILKSTGGGQNPRSISEWYDRLMTDAYGDGFEKFVKNGTFTPRSL
jgi:hypothetical protein